MKLNCGSFSLIFAFLLSCSINNVTSEETEFEAETESAIAALTIVTNGDEMKNDEIQSDEIDSDENEDNFDFTSVEISGGMDTTGMQISADQISPIVNQLLGPISSIVQPYLGPLAPLSSVLSSVITHTVTELIVNLINETIASAKRQEFLEIQNLNYTSYLVTVPNNGRFLLFTKTQSTHKTPKRDRSVHNINGD